MLGVGERGAAVVSDGVDEADTLALGDNDGVALALAAWVIVGDGLDVREAGSERLDDWEGDGLCVTVGEPEYDGDCVRDLVCVGVIDRVDDGVCVTVPMRT